nr:uncharacterized protein LOC110377131 [Helicoverpa armigera]
MVVSKLCLVFLIVFIYSSDCIKDGKPVSTDKRYVVYLVKAPKSAKVYDFWLCGGAIVSTLFIVTSAACVDDVEFMYAIAGYKNYVIDKDIEKDACIKAKKKKIVYTCVPMKYELNYLKVEKWSFIDIALVKVESPYDFNDQSYTKVCSYIPNAIAINYEPKFQRPDLDALVYGWGHTEKWREVGDHANYNQKELRYAATKIIDKTTCKQHYKVYPNMNAVIDSFMICTLAQGELSDKGELILIGPPQPKADGCGTQQLSGPTNLNEYSPPCENNGQDDLADGLLDVTRRKDTLNVTVDNKPAEKINKTNYEPNNHQSRKHGICQNDHGGPLVTWVGGNEVLIGVASVFKVSDDYKCMGPYLFTSTQCNGAFLDCILSGGTPNTEKRASRAICDMPPIQRGYDTVERFISWKNHPAGPAENERTSEENTRPKKKNNFANFVKLAVASLAVNSSVAVRPQKPIHDDSDGT